MSIISCICATVVKCDFVSPASLSLFLLFVSCVCFLFFLSHGGQLALGLMPVLAACHLIYVSSFACIVFLYNCWWQIKFYIFLHDAATTGFKRLCIGLTSLAATSGTKADAVHILHAEIIRNGVVSFLSQYQTWSWVHFYNPSQPANIWTHVTRECLNPTPPIYDQPLDTHSTVYTASKTDNISRNE